MTRPTTGSYRSILPSDADDTVSASYIVVIYLSVFGLATIAFASGVDLYAGGVVGYLGTIGDAPVGAFLVVIALLSRRR